MRHYLSRKRSPDRGNREVNAFLSSLAVESSVTASTRNPTAAALVFLYREGYRKRIEGGWRRIIGAGGSRPTPVLLTRSEVRQVLGRMAGAEITVALVLYGSGVRLGRPSSSG